MPVKTGTMYLVKCGTCDWSENVFIRESPMPLLSLFGGKGKLPEKCPECGGRVSSRVDLAFRQ
jgi:hypothetical protein